MKLHNEFTVPARVERAWDVLLDLERVAPCLPGAQLQGGDGREFEGQMAVKIGPVTSRYQGSVRIEQADADAHRAVMRAQARDARGAGTAAATISTAMRTVPEGTRVAVETDLQISGPAAQFGRGVMQEVSSKLMARFAACLAEEMAADAEGVQPGAMGANEATPAEAANGAQATTGATAAVVDWAAAAVARAPTRLGGYEDTAVGRLPTGPAGDSALAAAAARRPATPPPSRRTEEVLDLGEISRGAVLKRVVPGIAALVAAVLVVLALRARRPRERRD
jgi:carbon monoxide dehydrogenase subunit G